MAPLWHFFEECLLWYDELPSPRPQGLNTDALQQPHWDWLTVAVATCTENCAERDTAFSMRKEDVAGYNLLAGPAVGKRADVAAVPAAE